MEGEKVEKKEVGCLAFVIAGMSFIPLIGIVFGIITIIWGDKIKNTALKIIGACGIAFGTIVLYGFFGYFGFVQKGGIYDDLRGRLTKAQLTSAVQAIEFYKVQNGHYPESLEILQKSLPENSMVILYDAAQVSTNPKLYYYKIINENSYHIRSYGRDGVLNTEDDILPSPIANIGLIADYQVQSD